jgi:hypothetical protein
VRRPPLGRALRTAAVLLGLLVAVAAPASAAAPAAATAPAAQPEPGRFGIRLLDAPETRRDDPRALVSIVDHLSPGTTITRRVEIVSEHDEPLRVAVTPGPAALRDGEFIGVDEADGVAEVSDLPAWTTVERSEVLLAPGAREAVAVTIAVPQDAPAGERYGVIWAAVSSSPAAGPVRVVNRVGVRIYLSVGAGAEPASDFRIDELVPERDDGGAPVLRARVTNTGGRALDVTGLLDLRDGPGGARSGPFDPESGVAIPTGATASVRFPLPGDLPDGPWTAEVALRSGALERSATARLSFSAAVQAVPAAPVAPQGAPARPLDGRAVALAVLLLLLLILALLLVWRRRRRDDGDEPAAAVEAAGARAPALTGS